MNLIWATRGRAWGFRFIRTEGVSDPLPVYEAAFSGIEDEPEVWRRFADIAALRIRDPQGRRDQFGRPIFHEFALKRPLSDDVNSMQDALARVWPLVAAEYAAIYDLPTPPAASG